MSPVGIRPEKDSSGEAQKQPQITDPFSSQRGKRRCLKITSIEEKENFVAGPRWWPDTRTTGRLAIGRKVT
jgi:hypothetical protein